MPETPKNFLQSIVAFIKRLFKTCSKFSIDEVIAIFRPVVYMWSLIKYGKKSYRPIWISLFLDIAQAIVGIFRLRRSS